MAAPLLDRASIHKSVIALEGVASAFFEYTQAMSAAAAAEKKLVKAMKEASVKGGPVHANNALKAAAWVMESLSEVDIKFARIVEREYENTTRELDKFFKKLTRDEKEYDERTETSEAKIRQANQQHEKRALTKDAHQEHARYVNLLNSLLAENADSHASHNSAVNQRHNLIMFSVGTALSRIADATWVRSCEAVKRCSPGVGRVGETRVFCEAGWNGSIPNSLLDIDAPPRERRLSNQESPTPKETIAVVSPTYSAARSSEVGEALDMSPPAQRPEGIFRPPSYRSDLGPPTSSSSGSFNANRPLLDPPLPSRENSYGQLSHAEEQSAASSSALLYGWTENTERSSTDHIDVAKEISGILANSASIPMSQPRPPSRTHARSPPPRGPRASLGLKSPRGSAPGSFPQGMQGRFEEHSPASTTSLVGSPSNTDVALGQQSAMLEHDEADESGTEFGRLRRPALSPLPSSTSMSDGNRRRPHMPSKSTSSVPHLPLPSPGSRDSYASSRPRRLSQDAHSPDRQSTSPIQSPNRQFMSPIQSPAPLRSPVPLAPKWMGKGLKRLSMPMFSSSTTTSPLSSPKLG